MSITISPNEAIKIEKLGALSLWKEITVQVPFINKLIPPSNANRPIGKQCLIMLKAIAKKGKTTTAMMKRECPAMKYKLKGEKEDADKSVKQMNNNKFVKSKKKSCKPVSNGTSKMK